MICNVHLCVLQTHAFCGQSRGGGEVFIFKEVYTEILKKTIGIDCFLMYLSKNKQDRGQSEGSSWIRTAWYQSPYEYMKRSGLYCKMFIIRKQLKYSISINNFETFFFKCNLKPIFMFSRKTSLLICAILAGHQAGNFRMCEHCL